MHSNNNSDIERAKPRGILIYGDNSTIITNSFLGLICEGRRLADILQTTLSIVYFGEDKSVESQVMIECGADQVFRIKTSLYENYNDINITDNLCDMIKKINPEIVISLATISAKTIMARTAARLNTGLTADCVELDIDPVNRKLYQIRSAYSGSLMAKIICPNSYPQMCTVQISAMESVKKDKNRVGKVYNQALKYKDNKMVVSDLDFVSDYIRRNENSNVFFAVGAGVKTSRNCNRIKRISESLGASMGASRAAVEKGLMDYSYQIGQSGMKVKANLYIAFGISGAIQHMSGLKNVDTIIAINNNPNAAIFNYSDYGIVADVEDTICEWEKLLNI